MSARFLESQSDEFDDDEGELVYSSIGVLSAGIVGY